MIGMICLFSALRLTHAAGAMQILENVRKHMIRPTTTLRKPANPEADFATSREQQTGELTRASPSHQQGFQLSYQPAFGQNDIEWYNRHKSYLLAPTWSMIHERSSGARPLRNGGALTDYIV